MFGIDCHALQVIVIYSERFSFLFYLDHNNLNQNLAGGAWNEGLRVIRRPQAARVHRHRPSRAEWLHCTVPIVWIICKLGVLVFKFFTHLFKHKSQALLEMEEIGCLVWKSDSAFSRSKKIPFYEAVSHPLGYSPFWCITRHLHDFYLSCLKLRLLLLSPHSRHDQEFYQQETEVSIQPWLGNRSTQPLRRRCSHRT